MLAEDGLQPECIALAGDVSKVGIADAFEFINALRKTGVLYFFNDREALRRFYFENGELIFTTSENKAERLGEVMVSKGIIDEAQLRDAEQHLRPGAKIGAVLVARKHITPKELFEGVKEQIRAIVSGALTEEKGYFFFAAGPVKHENIVHFNINTRNLLLECIKTLDERNYIKRLLQAAQVKVTRTPGKDITPLYLRVARLLEDGLGIEKVSEITGLSGEEILDVILELRRQGVVSIRPVSKGSREGRDFKRFINDANSWLMDAFSVVASRTGEEKALERLNSFFEDIPDEMDRLFRNVRLDAMGKLDGDRLEKNLQAFPLSRRWEVLLTGMRELFNFVLFEILNTAGREAARPFENIIKLLESSHG